VMRYVALDGDGPVDGFDAPRITHHVMVLQCAQVSLSLRGGGLT
jgi:hypothetical protein